MLVQELSVSGLPDHRPERSLLNVMGSQSESKVMETHRGIQNTEDKTTDREVQKFAGCWRFLFVSFLAVKNSPETVVIPSSLSAIFVYSEV